MDGDSSCVLRKTVQWSAGEEPMELDLHPDGQRGGGAVTAVPTPQDSRRSAPRPVPGVQRTLSSPVSAVCRQCHSHLVVRCQVTCHHLPHLSSSCPAAFSPAWTWVLPPPSPGKPGAGRKRERRRRHTVGPASHLEQSRLRQLQQQHHHQQRGSEGSLQPPWSSLQGRGRSLSDSELQQLLMREMGLELKKMSDQFHLSKTGQCLTTVTESSGSSEDDSDDEM